MLTLDEQLAEFGALGTVVDTYAHGDETVAAELARMLMQGPLAGGPLARIANLTRLVNVLKLTARIVTGTRNREADSLCALWPYRRIASLLGVNGSTMQGWVSDGAKARIASAEQETAGVETQEVSRETTTMNGVANSNSISDFAVIQ